MKIFRTMERNNCIGCNIHRSITFLRTVIYYIEDLIKILVLIESKIYFRSDTERLYMLLTTM